MLRRDGRAKQTSAQTGAFVTSVDIIGIFVIYNNITARKIVQNLNPRSEKKEITESFVATFLFNNRNLLFAIISVILVILNTSAWSCFPETSSITKEFDLHCSYKQRNYYVYLLQIPHAKKVTS